MKTLFTRPSEGAFADTGFLIHLTVFVLVNLGLLVINLLATPNIYWFYWPLIGWGIGVLAHGLAVHYSRDTRAEQRLKARRARPIRSTQAVAK